MSSITKRISQTEFTLLVAALFGLMAFAIDSLLPALPQIGRELSADNVNRAQLVITAFILGNGFGQLLMGPLSDAFGRRPVIFGGLAVYAVGAVLAHEAGGLTALLTFRFLQGFGGAAPRTVGMAMVRDLYSGREMAKISSLAFMFFIIIPAVAPFFGQMISEWAGWRAILLFYILAAAMVAIWLALRQPETLPTTARVPFHATRIIAAARETFVNPICMIYTAALSFGFASLVAYISSAQQVFQDALGITDKFPIYFAMIAAVSALSAFVNSRLVMRLGMRRLARFGFASTSLASAVVATVWWSGLLPPALVLPAFMLWSMVLFFANGLSFGNLNALAMEPMGHIAGTASAVIGAVQTMISVALAVPVGLMFDGTPMPLLLATMAFSGIAFAVMALDPKSRTEQTKIPH